MTSEFRVQRRRNKRGRHDSRGSNDVLDKLRLNLSTNMSGHRSRARQRSSGLVYLCAFLSYVAVHLHCVIVQIIFLESHVNVSRNRFFFSTTCSDIGKGNTSSSYAFARARPQTGPNVEIIQDVRRVLLSLPASPSSREEELLFAEDQNAKEKESDLFIADEDVHPRLPSASNYLDQRTRYEHHPVFGLFLEPAAASIPRPRESSASSVSVEKSETEDDRRSFHRRVASANVKIKKHFMPRHIFNRTFVTEFSGLRVPVRYDCRNLNPPTFIAWGMDTKILRNRIGYRIPPEDHIWLVPDTEGNFFVPDGGEDGGGSGITRLVSRVGGKLQRNLGTGGHADDVDQRTTSPANMFKVKLFPDEAAPSGQYPGFAQSVLESLSTFVQQQHNGNRNENSASTSLALSSSSSFWNTREVLLREQPETRRVLDLPPSESEEALMGPDYQYWSSDMNQFDNSYYDIVPDRRAVCQQHAGLASEGGGDWDDRTRSGERFFEPELPVIDEEYGEHVEIYKSVVAYLEELVREGQKQEEEEEDVERVAHRPFVMLDVGARWGTWGFRALKALEIGAKKLRLLATTTSGAAFPRPSARVDFLEARLLFAHGIMHVARANGYLGGQSGFERDQQKHLEKDTIAADNENDTVVDTLGGAEEGTFRVRMYAGDKLLRSPRDEGQLEQARTFVEREASWGMPSSGSSTTTPAGQLHALARSDISVTADYLTPDWLHEQLLQGQSQDQSQGQSQAQGQEDGEAKTSFVDLVVMDAQGAEKLLIPQCFWTDSHNRPATVAPCFHPPNATQTHSFYTHKNKKSETEINEDDDEDLSVTRARETLWEVLRRSVLKLSISTHDEAIHAGFLHVVREINDRNRARCLPDHYEKNEKQPLWQVAENVPRHETVEREVAGELDHMVVTLFRRRRDTRRLREMLKEYGRRGRESREETALDLEQDFYQYTRSSYMSDRFGPIMHWDGKLTLVNMELAAARANLR